MLGYGRDMVQQVNIGGAYVQNEWKNSTWSMLVGMRLEKHNLLDNPVFSPRVNLRYSPHRDAIFRLTYAAGYRAPQAYDEDLHVGAVGGEAEDGGCVKTLGFFLHNGFHGFHRFTTC